MQLEFPLTYEVSIEEQAQRKKKETIQAYEKLVQLYRKPPAGHLYCCTEDCPLCAIHRPTCLGCPNRGRTLSGCYIDGYLRPSFWEVTQYVDLGNITRKLANARADTIEQIIEILKGIPAIRFTVGGWEYFEEIDGI